MTPSVCYNLHVQNPDEVLAKMRERIEREKPRVLILDGEIASGKSTFARLLGERVIAMDDFYLPRGRQVYVPAHGHMDLERFEREVIARLSEETFAYRRFDYYAQAYFRKVVPPGGLTIIEGNYAMVECLGDYFDEAFFLSVGKELQFQRVLERNGPGEWPDYRDLWIPLSERYFLENRVRERCTAIFSMSENGAP